MVLFITIEAQNAIEIGISQILYEIVKELDFVTNRNIKLEEKNNYGLEFRDINIIPTCMSNEFWMATGWKERKFISRKNKSADIRLRINYEKFIIESFYNKRLMLIDIIESIKVIQEKSKSDFDGELLIKDILRATNTNYDELESIRGRLA